ncbi:MAG: hypothetical protein ACPGF7_08960 [Pontibacterium sp.]
MEHLPIEMSVLCEGFAQGWLSHDNEADVCNQLMSEDYKRLEAFYFEQLFELQLRSAAGHTGHLSFGWLVGYGPKEARYGFRLVTGQDDCWNDCDNRVSRVFLQEKVNQVFCITLQGHHFSATNIRTGAELPLDDALALLPLRKAYFKGRGPVYACRYAADHLARKRRAMQALSATRFAGVKRKLSVQRRLINGYLRPWLRGQPSDLDAMYLNPAGQLNYIEFKRKYPSRGWKVYGLDERPHCHMVRYFKERNVCSFIVILVNPGWHAEVEPLGLIRPPERWVWLGCHLGEGAIDYNTQLSVSGQKAGQDGGNRVQYAINWNAFGVLAPCLALGDDGRGRLLKMLTDESWSQASCVSYQVLRRMTGG